MPTPFPSQKEGTSRKSDFFGEIYLLGAFAKRPYIKRLIFKTINFGKESVHISSIEQLDGSNEGYLTVYTLERMSPSFNGIKLNTLVNELIAMIRPSHYKETFLAKLSLYGFDFSEENDNLVYDLKSVASYRVDNADFPRVTRDLLPASIIKVQYDIVLSEIERFKML